MFLKIEQKSTPHANPLKLILGILVSSAFKDVVKHNLQIAIMSGLVGEKTRLCRKIKTLKAAALHRMQLTGMAMSKPRSCL